ncbi:MAG: hypothetical protein RLZZ494_217 [Pseudomonadota bacterium]
MTPFPLRSPWLRWSLGVCLAWAAWAPAHSASGVDVDSTTPYLGIGINQLSYFDGAQAMADVVRESQFRGTDWSETPSVDAHGNPTQDFILIFSSDRFAAGTYTLVFQGWANVGVSGAAENGGAGPYITNKRYNKITNTTTADVVVPNTLTGNCWFNFGHTRRTSASTRADGLSDLHLWRPGYATDGSVLFTQEFVKAMKKFHVIRGMDFVSANSNASVNWSDRTDMNFQGYVGSKGQPWELLVQLANATDRDLWINVPVQANDAYIRNLARLIRYGSDGVTPYSRTQTNPVYAPLKAGLRVYVEYGNELWNSGAGFYGFGWSLNLATKYMADTTHPIAYDGALTDTYLAHRRWIAYRSASIGLIFRQVFGDAAMMGTVRPVLASQVGNANVYLSEGLKWAEGFYGQVRTSPANSVARQVNQLWWGAGGAAYYDSTTAPTDTSAATMRAYFAGLPSAEFASNTAIDATWSRGYGLKSVAYEGGPGPGGSSSGSATGSVELAATYNADSRMWARMKAAHQIYTANGGELLNYYVYSGSPPWDFVNDLNPGVVSDTSTVKLRTIDTIRMAPKAAPTLGTAVPGTVWFPNGGSVGVQFDGAANWRYNGQAIRLPVTTGTGGKAFSGMALIPIRAEQAGTYRFSLAMYPEADTQVELMINGELAGTFNIPGTCGGICADNAYATSPVIKAALPAGLSVVRVRPVNNDIWIRRLIVR